MSLKLPSVEPGSGNEVLCPIRDVLDCVGDKWSLLTLAALSSGTLRFSRLKQSIGDVSQRMLAKTLRSLERDGYVSRKVYPTIPPKVEYSLTPLGASLLTRVEPLIEWASKNHDAIRNARKQYVPIAAITAL
jgi:DNA-binding HxlR family transcriptional regulator